MSYSSDRKPYYKAQIGGYLAKDPEYKILATGDGVVQFSIPYMFRTKTKEPVTDWLNCEAYGPMAVFIAENFRAKSWIKITDVKYVKLWMDKGGHIRRTYVVQEIDANLSNTEGEEYVVDDSDIPI